MQVEIDDADGDWTRPGVYQVTPGVFRIPLPLPNDGLRAVNVYAVAPADGELVLVDSGWGVGPAREALDKALAALDRQLADVREFLVTHVHRDHYGMAVAVRREFGTRVGLGEGERASIEVLSRPIADPGRRRLELLRAHGADPLIAVLRGRLQELDHDPEHWRGPDVWLADGTDIALADRTLRVVATPGHTQGHIVFVDAAAGLLFAGDHILPHITPSIGYEAVSAPLPLGDYMRSLRLVRDMPDRRLLPAHGPVRSSTHARIDQLLDHHGQRLDHALAAVSDDAGTAYRVADRLTWTRREKAFADLDPFNQMLAVTETAAHLDLLVAQGRLRCSELDGVVHYTHP